MYLHLIHVYSISIHVFGNSYNIPFSEWWMGKVWRNKNIPWLLKRPCDAVQCSTGAVL